MSKYLVVLVIAAALLYSPAKNYLTLLGVFRSVPNPPIGPPCQLFTHPGLAGCEDVTFYRDSLFIASCHPDRFAFAKNLPAKSGNLFLIDLKTPKTPQAHPLTVVNQKYDDESNKFQPHGISLYQDGESVYIFVINHLNLSNNAIDIFLLSDPSSFSITHVKRVQHPLLRTPNDIHAVGVDKFYFTNDHYFPPTSLALQILEQFSTVPISDLVYCHGDTCQTAVNHMASPNGVNGNHDNSIIYLAETLTGKVHFYNRNSETGDLYETGSIALDNLLDNIEVDRVTGELYVAVHPIGLKIFGHLLDPKIRSPARIIKVSNNTKEDLFLGVKYMTQDVIFNDGSVLGGVSTATYNHKSKSLVLSAIFDEGLMICSY